MGRAGVLLFNGSLSAYGGQASGKLNGTCVVEVACSLETDTVLASGLDGGETVVTEGQLLLSNGSKVSARQIKVGS